MAALLKERFVCAWEKKGAVESYRVRGAPEQNFKVGGNILTYVCTPKGEVIHALPGSWPPEVYKQHLQWAQDVRRDLVDLKTQEAVARVRAAHREPPSFAHPERVRQAHELLTAQAFRPITEIERMFFESLLRETYAPDREIVIREIDEGDFKELLANMPRG